MITDDQIEAKAREICQNLGLDPDERIMRDCCMRDQFYDYWDFARKYLAASQPLKDE